MVHTAGMVEITEGEKAGTYLKGGKIMISTGCKPRTLPEIPVDGKQVMTSREALAMTEQPESIAIMGAGAIGAEFAYFSIVVKHAPQSRHLQYLLVKSSTG